MHSLTAIFESRTKIEHVAVDDLILGFQRYMKVEFSNLLHGKNCDIHLVTDDVVSTLKLICHGRFVMTLQQYF